MHAVIDFILKIDEHLFALTETYGAWVYGVIFPIVFAETGLVVTPLLPGDSLLFAAGALCGAGLLNPWIMATVLLSAAIIGDAVNYSVGRSLGPKVFSAHDQSSRLHRLLNREHLEKAHAFFEKHGGKAIVIARFVPDRSHLRAICRRRRLHELLARFAFYNVAGAFLWVASCFGLGYIFGNVPIVKENFSAVAIIIIFISILPVVWEFIQGPAARAKGPSSATTGCLR